MTTAQCTDFAATTRQYLREGRTDIYRQLLANFEAIVLRAAWDELGGHQGKMSESLGLARMTLRSKLRDAGLIAPDAEKST
jgi:DNA-binding protein Fis